MSEANLVAYAIQVAIIVFLCAGLPRLLGLQSPGVQYAFWRTLLLLCLILPFVQPRQTAEMVFAPAAVQPSHSAAPPTSGPPPDVRPAPGFNWMAAAQIVVPIGIAG